MPNDENKIEKLNVVLCISRNIFYKFVYYFIVARRVEHQPTTQKQMQIHVFEYWCTLHVSASSHRCAIRGIETNLCDSAILVTASDSMRIVRSLLS